jgi:hypothetical protein
VSEFCLAFETTPFTDPELRWLCLRAKGHEDLDLPHHWEPMWFVQDSEICLDLAYSMGHGRVLETLNAYPARWEDLVPQAFR